MKFDDCRDPPEGSRLKAKSAISASVAITTVFLKTIFDKPFLALLVEKIKSVTNETIRASHKCLIIDPTIPISQIHISDNENKKFWNLSATKRLREIVMAIER